LTEVEQPLFYSGAFNCRGERADMSGSTWIAERARLIGCRSRCENPWLQGFPAFVGKPHGSAGCKGSTCADGVHSVLTRS
jgi:hypothetical protein